MATREQLRAEIAEALKDAVITIRIPVVALAEVHPAISALAANLDRLRIEAGWSFDEMYKATGISKKLSIGHIRHNKGVAPHNLRAYVDAFEKALHRHLTVRDISGAQ